MKKRSLFKKLSEYFTSALEPSLAHKKRDPVWIRNAIGSSLSFVSDPLNNTQLSIVIVLPEFEEASFLFSDLQILNNNNAVLFPPTHHKPYDDQQMHESTTLVQRSEAIEFIQRNRSSLVVTSPAAIFDKVASPSEFNKHSILIEKGAEINPDILKEKLVDQNYNTVRFVERPGEFASRGGILDVYPFSGDYPIRLEFFGDEVDSIREFEPDSQRSVAFLNSARFIPNVSELNSEEKDSLFNYLQDDILLIEHNPSLILTKLEERFKQAQEAYSNLADNTKYPPPEQWFLSAAEYETVTNPLRKVRTGAFSEERNNHFEINLNISPHPQFNGSFKLLRQNISELSAENFTVYILCDNHGQKDRFEELLGESSDEFNYHLITETLHEGFILRDEKVALYTDHQIFNRYHRPKTKRKRTGGISLKEIKELNIGDFVVHVDYGIGKFAGFKNIKVRGNEQESVVLRYKNDSVLYVNVTSLHKLQKYSGKEGTQPKITKLGSGEWARKKAQTKKKVKDIARELIKLYAKRKAQKAYAFPPDNSWQTELEASFEFEETPDQHEAIQAVKEDMEQQQPMDRLVCGDVGFGKTEVAVRAAFKAVNDGKQVAVLVPTTILAEQHFKTFSKRMEHFPVRIESLSRFKTKAEQKKIIRKTEQGEVDILIGTHRITSKDVNFKDLGLLIVDEEQRFGVKVKDKLKEFRATVDVLTLTATPIPRTLQFSLMGARDLSIINTPPPNRQPVYTEIHSFNENLLRDAIIQEISRGGQVFFIHNRVKNIEEVAEMVRRLVPDIRVRFAHGQMPPSKLEKIIADFYLHKFDVLVSTNIVENGIDISNANTMIINRADRFGLAELHQLRGRVGRSNRKAFCYLITPPINTLTPEARKRLLALEEFSDLGSGFNIAMRDLDIRGAGDLLGGEQSGFINDIGFELYTKILNDAVKELKESEFSEMFKDVEVEAERPETKVEFDASALLPAHYVNDNVERLNLYRRLSKAKTEEEIDEWRDEIKDRFGPVPKEAESLISGTKIKLFASHNFFIKVTVRSDRMWLTCPKPDSETGEKFYGEGLFQELLEKIEKTKPGKYQVIQKEDAVRFVIKEIPELVDAIKFLKNISPEPAEQAIEAHEA